MKRTKSHKLNYENLIDMFPCAHYVIRDSIILGQGYLLSKPLPAEENEILLDMYKHNK